MISAVVAEGLESAAGIWNYRKIRTIPNKLKSYIGRVVLHLMQFILTSPIRASFRVTGVKLKLSEYFNNLTRLMAIAAIVFQAL
jgi:hypothetical protein